MQNGLWITSHIFSMVPLTLNVKGKNRDTKETRQGNYGGYWDPVSYKIIWLTIVV